MRKGQVKMEQLSDVTEISQAVPAGIINCRATMNMLETLFISAIGLNPFLPPCSEHTLFLLPGAWDSTI